MHHDTYPRKMNMAQRTSQPRMSVKRICNVPWGMTKPWTMPSEGVEVAVEVMVASTEEMTM